MRTSKVAAITAPISFPIYEPTPAPAPAAPAATPITPAMRRAIVLARLEKLTAGSNPSIPVDVSRFKTEGTDFLPDETVTSMIQFGRDIAQLQRMGQSKAKLSTILRIGARVATAYGVDMATIDPCHGSAA